MTANRHQLVRSVAFQMLDSVLDRSMAAYVSGPLQTGRLYYEVKAGHLPPTVNVRDLNGLRLSQFAKGLRQKLTYPVIDPGLLVVEGWSADDYLDLYLEILRRYAKEVWFIEGWQYSNGATAEYRAAVDAGIPCLDERGNLLSPAQAKGLSAAAVDHVWRLSSNAAGLHDLAA